MLESIKIIQLYSDNSRAFISNKYDEKIKEIKNNIKIINEYNNLVNSFKASMMELYTSQFKEGQTETSVPSKTLAIVEYGHDTYTFDYILNNSNYENEEMVAALEQKNKELSELQRLCASVNALLSICKTKEEVEDVLIRYEIIDKRTKKINLKDI